MARCRASCRAWHQPRQAASAARRRWTQTLTRLRLEGGEHGTEHRPPTSRSGVRMCSRCACAACSSSQELASLQHFQRGRQVLHVQHRARKSATHNVVTHMTTLQLLARNIVLLNPKHCLTCSVYSVSESSARVRSEQAFGKMSWTDYFHSHHVCPGILVTAEGLGSGA